MTGFMLWQMTLKSDAVVTTSDQLFLLFYVGLTLGAYLGSLVLANRFINLSSREAIPGLLFVSLVGVSLPFVVNSVHVWFLTYRVDYGWFVRHSLEALVLLNIIMLVVMAVCAAVGFVLTKIIAAFVRMLRAPNITGS